MNSELRDIFNQIDSNLLKLSTSNLDYLFDDYVIPEPMTNEPLRKRGKPSFLSKFPEVTSIITSFLEDSSVAAHPKRQNSIMYADAQRVTVMDIRAHVIKELRKRHPGFCGVSWHTIRRIGMPPATNFNASVRYKRIIPFKQAPRQNDTMDEHDDFHYTAALVKSVRECAVYFKDDVAIFSNDDKNKIPMNNTAVSHYLKPQGMHLTHLQPHDPDHDFPAGPADSTKITPEGFMELRPLLKRSLSTDSFFKPCPKLPLRRARSCDSFDIIRGDFDDKFMRKRLELPSSGHQFIYLSAQCHYRATSCRHVNSMIDFLKLFLLSNGKTTLFNIVDGGPDWSFKSLANIFTFGKMWMLLNLDSITHIE